MTGSRLVLGARVGIAALLLFAVGCSGTHQTLSCPETEPVVVEVPIPVADSSLVRFREFVTEQQIPTTLNALGDSTSTVTIANEALLEVAYWRKLWRDLREFLRPTGEIRNRLNEGQ